MRVENEESALFICDFVVCFTSEIRLSKNAVTLFGSNFTAKFNKRLSFLLRTPTT